MANRYWNPAAAANWGDANVWALTDGGTADQATPTSADDVFFTSTNVNNCAVAATANCLSFSTVGGTGYTGTLSGTGALNVYGNFATSSAMNRTYSGTITFMATSVGKTVSFGGRIMANTTDFNGIGGAWTIQDAWNNGASDISLTNGSLNTNGQTITCGSFSSSNSNTRSLTLGASTINCNIWNFNVTTGLTASFASSTIALTGTSYSSFYGGGFTYNIVNLTIGSNYAYIIGANTFGTLTLNGGAYKTGNCNLAANQTITGTFTVTGNSIINRLLINSNTTGTAITITAATVTIANADFRDITGAGAGSWNLSAITGGSGDCGGNTGITFTTPTTQDCSAGTTWSTATWTSRVPLPQDSATFSGASRTITQDMPRIGSVNFTGSSGLTWTTSTVCECYGSINLTNLATLTASSEGYKFMGRGSCTLTSAGKTWAKDIYLYAPTGTLTLKDDFINSLGLYLYNGIFDASDGGANHNITISYLSTPGTATMTMGGIWTLTNTSGYPWHVYNTTTVNCGISTIKLTGALTADINFLGGGKTYYNIWNATTNAYSFIIDGSNTFNDIKLDAGRTLKLTAGTTTTLTTLTAIGAGTVMTSATAAAHTLSCASGTIAVQNCTISYSHATGGATFNAFTTLGNTDGGNNTGWNFSVPSTGGGLMFGYNF